MADVIADLVKQSLPKKTGILIIPYDYQSLVSEGKRQPLFHSYHVCFILGTTNPNIDGIPFLSIFEIMDKKNVNYIKELKKDIAEMQEYFPVICGEWCLFNSLAVGCDTKGGQTVLNGVEGMAQETVSAEEKKRIYNAVAEAQLDAWNAGSGYFYWSYKLLTDTVNTPGWVGWDSWDFGRCVDFGWFPIEK